MISVSQCIRACACWLWCDGDNFCHVLPRQLGNLTYVYSSDIFCCGGMFCCALSTHSQFWTHSHLSDLWHSMQCPCQTRRQSTALISGSNHGPLLCRVQADERQTESSLANFPFSCLFKNFHCHVFFLHVVIHWYILGPHKTPPPPPFPLPPPPPPPPRPII